MSERSYPYEAFVVGSTGKVNRVKIVGPAFRHSWPNWDKSESGRNYGIDSLHPTKESAIAAGLAACDAAQAKLDNSQAKLNAKLKNLEAQR